MRDVRGQREGQCERVSRHVSRGSRRELRLLVQYLGVMLAASSHDILHMGTYHPQFALPPGPAAASAPTAVLPGSRQHGHLGQHRALPITSAAALCLPALQVVGVHRETRKVEALHPGGQEGLLG